MMVLNYKTLMKNKTRKLSRFITKNRWVFDNLEKLNVNEFDLLLEAIPSDGESVVSDNNSYEDEEIENLCIGEEPDPIFSEFDLPFFSNLENIIPESENCNSSNSVGPILPKAVKEDDGISIKEIPCPKLVKDYNQYMGGVDKVNMLKSIYEVTRKSKK
ncbi:hypothetical protein ILUMI_12840 [Ignelater luminosus]|uniref:Uncharacterized protein n=1 Tax=Ignelater luminosus TaxID=2038154 RepID=A0A8K0CTD0_IGNLU|nr:hypothetical protein ILUMI_12840 [Ignelater luminosus]